MGSLYQFQLLVSMVLFRSLLHCIHSMRYHNIFSTLRFSVSHLYILEGIGGEKKFFFFLLQGSPSTEGNEGCRLQNISLMHVGCKSQSV